MEFMTDFEGALAHLKAADPKLAAAIEKVGPIENDLDSAPNYFQSLARIIVGQQLSVAVARAIWKRVEAHFGEDFSPETVAKTEAETLRGLGLSGAKAKYLHSLANHVLDGKLKVGDFDSLSDEEIKAEIVAVNGLGPWSADMFLMFTLKRSDILPVGDLGIREAFKRLYELENRPNAVEMEKLSKNWRPYRTIACRYLWRYLDLPAEF